MTKEIGAFLLAAASLVFAGYQWGQSSAADTYRVEQAKAKATADKEYRAEVDRGRAAARDYAASLTVFKTTFQDLEGKFNDLKTRVPLVVLRPAVVQPAARTDRQPASETAAASPTDAPVAMAAPGLGLSLGAVWMWNSALAGADRPAGACGAADTATEPCAADAGLGLADAWANHETNARTCAEDRLRFQSLIDYLNGRKQ